MLINLWPYHLTASKLFASTCIDDSKSPSEKMAFFRFVINAPFYKVSSLAIYTNRLNKPFHIKISNKYSDEFEKQSAHSQNTNQFLMFFLKMFSLWMSKIVNKTNCYSYKHYNRALQILTLILKVLETPSI